MTDRHDNDEQHVSHPDWIVERRECPLCCVKACGCPHEPELRLIPANIILGDE